MPKITLYTTDYCSYCVSAKQFLQARNLAFEEIDITKDTELRNRLSAQYNWRTVPMIIIDGTFVGGFDDLVKLAKAGGLPTDSHSSSTPTGA